MYHLENKSHFRTCFKLLDMTRKYVKEYLTQYVFHNSKMVHRHLYDIEYTIHFKKYRLRIPCGRGPSKYFKFIDTNSDKDITEEIAPYVGPNDDFHHFTYMPHDFGYTSITVMYTDGTSRTFTEMEVIS